MILKGYLERNKRFIDRALRDCLLPPNPYSPVLQRAIRYSLFPGGRRVRPILAIAAYNACDGKGEAILPFACALEMIHTSFLIHDDLPALDNEIYRRGRLTVQRKFGEEIAILAGEGLLILAFSVMIEGKNSELTRQAIREISNAIGMSGVVSGQAAEMENRSRGERRKENRKRIWEYIHTHKTAALIKAAVSVGAIVAHADEKRIDSLAKFGQDFGFSFQITDDLLDNDGYAKILGRRRAKEKAAFLTQRAIKHLECFGRKADALRELATFCLNRM